MKKNRLFFKIYLWFWLTTIVLLLTISAIDIMTQSVREKEHLQYFVGRILVFQGQQAVNVYENENAESMRRFLEHMGRMPGFHMYIYNEEGREITGHKASPQISALAAAALKDKTTDTIISTDKNVVLKSITSYNRKKYLIAANVPHRPVRLLLLLGSPPPPEPGLGPKPGPEPGMEPGPEPPLGPYGGMSFLILRLAAILIVSGIICYLLTRYLTAPIVKLSDAAHRFAAGDFSIRVNSEIGKRKDEISDLASDFDHMVGRIESLLTSQRTLLRDISHELRSPLARINVALELCRSRSEGEAIKYLDRIGQEAETLNELIEQILTLNRVESGVAESKKEKIDLNDLIGKIRGDANFEAESRKRSVRIVKSEQCVITGNEKLIRRAVENVLRNAVIYTDPRSAVELSLKRVWLDGYPYAAITVRDHGPGVPENEIANIFQPFYRVDGDRDRKTGGTGVGLAIADAAVRLHGGSIKAANATGGGLSVEIMLPVEK
ncbi:MAG: ATP-binding protein [Smithella sp.]